MGLRRGEAWGAMGVAWGREGARRGAAEGRSSEGRSNVGLRRGVAARCCAGA